MVRASARAPVAAALARTVVFARSDERVNQRLRRCLRREAQRGKVRVAHADARLRVGVLGGQPVDIVRLRRVVACECFGFARRAGRLVCRRTKVPSTASEDARTAATDSTK